MSTKIGFLRAVNVGRRRVAMAQVVSRATALGYDDVWTFVNSGNVVFSAGGRREALERSLETAFEDEFGFEVTTFVRTLAELETILAARPFPVGDDDTYFVTFLKQRPTASQARQLEAASNEFDTVVVDGRDVHWRMHGSSIDTKIPGRVWEAAIGAHRTTSRNTTMLRRLVAKAHA